MGLSPAWRIGDLRLTEEPYSVVFGADHGAPDSSAEVLPSFLLDGDLELTARLGNRSVTLQVMIEASDMAAMSQAEARLVEECDRPLNTLVVDPGDGYGEAYQFTVFRGSVVFNRDDDFEVNGVRVYTITWRALPWPEAAREVTDTLVASNVGTAKQQIGTFPVRGAVASRGSLSVQHATTALGKVLVYTGSDEYVPANRAYRTYGPTPTVTAGPVSGAIDALTGPSNVLTRYVRPVSSLPPGEYSVVVFGNAGVGGCLLHFSMSSLVGGSYVPNATVEGTKVTAPHYGGYDFFDLGPVTLPIGDLPSAATIQLDIVNDIASPTFTLDETYLFNISTGRMSRFNCGTGTPSAAVNSNRLWIDSPGVENDGLGRYVRGTQADRSDAFSSLYQIGSGPVDATQPFPSVHEFPATGTQVFVVASEPATASTITYRYRPAGHSSVYTGL